jgi:Zn-finger in Ran binding protein and others
MHSPTSTIPGNVFDSPDSQSNAKKATPVVNGNLFATANKAPFPLKSSAPKEPSKLRFGFAATESDPDSPPPIKSVSDTPAPAPPLDQTNVSPKLHTIPSRPTASTPVVAVASPLSEAGPSSEPQATKATTPKDLKQAALLLDTASLPSFPFNVTTGLKPLLNHAKEREAALVADSSSLPTFAFVFGAKPASTGFNWEAAGMKVPIKAADSWKCPVCMIDNNSAKTKCGACEEPRPESAATKGTAATPLAAISGSSKPAAATGGFNWSAAGLKVPMKTPGTWKCNVCMVDNEVTKTKCAACEEPRA